MTAIRRFVRNRPTLTAVLIFLALFALAHLLLATQPAPITTGDELLAHLLDGQPTVVEFYSNL